MSVSIMERLFGYSEKSIEGDFEFSDFLQKVGQAFLRYELPAYVPAPDDVKEFLRVAGIRCRVPAFLSLLLGAIRIYEERKSFRVSNLPLAGLFQPFGISDEAICRYVGLSGLVVVVSKISSGSSIDGVVSVQRILTSNCKGAVTFRRTSPCTDQFSGFSSLHTSAMSAKYRPSGKRSCSLPVRVAYRHEDAAELHLRGFSPFELGMFLRALLSVVLSLRQNGRDAILGSEITEERSNFLDILYGLRDKASGCVFSVNPDTGFFVVEFLSGEDFLLLVSDN